MVRGAVLVNGKRGYVVTEKGDEFLVSFGSPNILLVPKKEVFVIEHLDREKLLDALVTIMSKLQEEADDYDERMRTLTQNKIEPQPSPKWDQALQKWDQALQTGLIIGEINSGKYDIVPDGVKKQIPDCIHEKKCETYEETGHCEFILDQRKCPKFEAKEEQAKC